GGAGTSTHRGPPLPSRRDRSVICTSRRSHPQRPWSAPSPGTERMRKGPGHVLRTWPGPFGSAGRDSGEGVAAGAGAARIGVVDREALLLDGVGEVDDCTAEVRAAHLVDDHLDALEVDDLVVVHQALVEVELVDQPGAAAGLHRDPQAEVVTALLLQQARDLLRGAGREGDAVRRGGTLGGGRGHAVLLEARFRPGYAPAAGNGEDRRRRAASRPCTGRRGQRRSPRPAGAEPLPLAAAVTARRGRAPAGSRPRTRGARRRPRPWRRPGCGP